MATTCDLCGYRSSEVSCFLKAHYNCWLMC